MRHRLSAQDLIFYRCFKNFYQFKFINKLKKRIFTDLSLESFLEIFQSTLNLLVSYKQENVLYNNNPFMTKELGKQTIIENCEMNLVNLACQKNGKKIHSKRI